MKWMYFPICALILFPAALTAEWKAKTECESCHDAEFKAYAGSEHHLGQTSCHDCHGGNPEAAKKADAHLEDDGFQGSFVDHVIHCGKCHEGIRMHYQRSPHFEKFDPEVFDLLSCTTCHKYHQVEKTTDSWFKTNCERCHRSNPKEMLVGTTFKQIAVRNKMKMQTMIDDREWLLSRGFAAASEGKQLDLLKTVLKQIGPVSHAINKEDVKKIDGEAKPLVDRTLLQIESKKQSYSRVKSILLPVWVVLILFSIVLLRASRRVPKE